MVLKEKIEKISTEKNPKNLKKKKKKKKKKGNALPEVDVGVVEDVGVRVQVVEALRRQDHPDVVAAVEERDHLEEELLGCDLREFEFFCRGGGVGGVGAGSRLKRDEIFLSLSLSFLFQKNKNSLSLSLSPGRRRRCR